MSVFKEKNKNNNRSTLTLYKNCHSENKSENLVQKESFSTEKCFKTIWTTSIQEDFVVFNSAVEGSRFLI